MDPVAETPATPAAVVMKADDTMTREKQQTTEPVIGEKRTAPVSIEAESESAMESTQTGADSEGDGEKSNKRERKEDDSIEPMLSTSVVSDSVVTPEEAAAMEGTDEFEVATAEVPAVVAIAAETGAAEMTAASLDASIAVAIAEDAAVSETAPAAVVIDAGGSVAPSEAAPVVSAADKAVHATEAAVATADAIAATTKGLAVGAKSIAATQDAIAASTGRTSFASFANNNNNNASSIFAPGGSVFGGIGSSAVGANGEVKHFAGQSSTFGGTVPSVFGGKASGAIFGGGGAVFGSSSGGGGGADGNGEEGGGSSSTNGSTTDEPASGWTKPKHVDLRTGEEDEMCMFQTRVKLYKLMEEQAPSTAAAGEGQGEDGKVGTLGGGSGVLGQRAFGTRDTTKLPAAAEPSVATGEEEEKTKSVDETAETAEKEASTDAAVATPAVVVQKAQMKWKELGSGTLKLNKPKTKSAASTGAEGGADAKPRAPRLVMRQDGVLKVLLNALVSEQMPVEKASEKMIRVVCDSRVDDVALGLTNAPGVDTFLMRLSRKDQCDELYNQLNRLRDSTKANQQQHQYGVSKANLD